MIKPKFIVFEGLDGCGKTTQLNAIGAWLATEFARKGWPAPYLTQQPGGTALGQQLRSTLLERDGDIEPLAELLLFQADRAQHVPEIKRQLSAGRWVLCDRYTASTIAYQGYGRGLPLETIEALNDIATGNLEPDLTIWLDVPPHVAMIRRIARAAELGQSDKIDGADAEFYLRVYEGFCAQGWAKRQTKYEIHPRSWVIVPGEFDECDVTCTIQQEIKKQWPETF